MKYRLAIFDFDGTLVSSLDGISACMTDAYSLDEVRATVGLTLEDSVRILTKGRVSDAQLPAVVQLYRELHDTKAASSIKLFDGVVELLEELPSHGIKSALVSNKGRKGLDHLLEGFRIWAFFDLVFSAEDVRFNKPKPELYSKHIAPHFAKVLASDTIVIGDAEVDLRFARATGLACCWARYGYGDEAKCRALHPDYEIGKIGELRDILRGGRE
jgi:phosphoglycolate phosphatase